MICRAPLEWISPSAVSAEDEPPPRGRFALRSEAFVRKPEVEIRQDGQVLWSGRLAGLNPGRSRALPCTWIARIRPDGGPIEVALAGAAIDS